VFDRPIDSDEPHIHAEAIVRSRRVLQSDATYHGLAHLFGALAEPTRARIIHLLTHEALCTKDLAAVLDLNDSVISQHLHVTPIAPRLLNPRIDAALERIWLVVAGEADGWLYAGGDPGVLFESRDGGASWELNRALWEHPSRERWQPGGGGLCTHSIVPWPGDPSRLLLAISAAGVWLTEDGGGSWRRGNQGLVARYLPEGAQEEASALCVHHVERSPVRPERLFMQFHGGVYRSDDAGESWSEIGAELPSDFGFPLAVDPQDPDSAYVIPLHADMDRVTPEGQVRVYATRDGGRSWRAQAAGLPQEHAYLTVLRLAFDRIMSERGLELYFGSTTGEVFGTHDAGEQWFTVAARLPPIYSLSAS